jgi:hypothetical protein
LGVEVCPLHQVVSAVSVGFIHAPTDAVGASPHAFVLEALERQTRREEQVAAFVEEALAADRAIEGGDEVYAAADVHAWLARLARGERSARPRPWRE